MPTELESIVCDCGSRREKQSGFRLDDDPSSVYHGMWVHGQCGKPAKLYFERLEEADLEL